MACSSAVAVPCGLVAVEHGPGLGVVHHGPHEFRGGGQPLLHPPQLPGQGVGPVHHLRRPLRQGVIVGQAVLLEKLEGGGHLFQIIDFRPAFISWALALGHALLNVNNQIDAPWSCRAGPPLGALADGSPPVNHRLHILQAVAVPQGGGPEPGGAENVYFLNAVTVADLLALAEPGREPEAPPPVVEPDPEPEPDPAPEPEPKKSGGAGMLLAALAVLVLGGGAGWYFKIYRPKQQKAAEPEEDFSEYDEPEDYDDAPPWDVDDEDEGGDE